MWLNGGFYAVPTSVFDQFSLHPALNYALTEQGIDTPTPIQEQSLPLTLANQDMFISAETGSGKTLAYLLPLLQRLLNEPANSRSGTRALVLLPTRELAEQVFKLCTKMAHRSQLKTIMVTGGQETRYQAAMLRKDPDIVVATPGRLLQLLNTGAAKLDDTVMAVLDEADRMLDMGFQEDVLAILERTNPNKQTLLLSATLKHRGVINMGKTILKQPKQLFLSAAQDVHDGLAHKLILSDDFDQKVELVKALLNDDSHQQILLFANRIESVNKLAYIFAKVTRTNKLHGDMRQDDRKKVINAFRQTQFRLLVATDVAARGLDIDGIDLVINFDMPHSGDEYVHRAGRTGRAGTSGTVISLVSAPDWNLSESIQRYLKQKFEPMTISGLKAKFKGPDPKKNKKKKKAAAKNQKPTVKKPAKKRATPRGSTRSESTNTGGFSPPKRPKK